MTGHIMLDIETLGTKAGCVVLSVGAAAFDPATGEVSDTFYEAIAFKDSILYGLWVDPDTYAWWKKQDPEAFRQAFAGETKLVDGCKRFMAWAAPLQAEHWWAQGADFDFPIMLKAIQMGLGNSGGPAPWKFWQTRDTRTLYAVAGFDAKAFPREGTYHNALDDSLHQIKCVHECYRLLGKGGTQITATSSHSLEDLL